MAKKKFFTIHFKFDLDRKLNLWVKLEPYFLKRLPNGKIEKTTVYPLLSLFIKSSAIEISLFSRKAYEKVITMPSSEKIMGCHAHCWVIANFNWQSSISRQICHVFNMRAHEGALNDTTIIWIIWMANTIDIYNMVHKLERKKIMSSHFKIDDDLNSAVSTYILLQQPHR